MAGKFEMSPLIAQEVNRACARESAQKRFESMHTMDLGPSKQIADRIKVDSRNQDTGLYREATEMGISLNDYLETLDPSPRDPFNEVVSPLDALERVLYHLQTPARGPITVDQFISGPAAILMPALILQWVNEGMEMGFGSMGVFSAVRPISGMTMTPLYLEGDEQQGVAKAPPTTRTGKRLGAAAKSGLPKTIVTYRDKDVKLGVYGRVLDFSYEVVKYASLDELRLIFLFIGLQIAYDDIGNIFEIIDVGDGTSGTPPTRLQISGAGGAGTLTWQDIVMAVARLGEGGFRVTHWVGESDSLVDFLSIPQLTGAPGSNIGMLLGEILMQRGPYQTPFGTILISPNPPADVDHLAFFDQMFAVAKAQESALVIELDKIIAMRWEEVAISGTWGFWKWASDASGVIDYSA